jgi:hypothetical protein
LPISALSSGLNQILNCFILPYECSGRRIKRYILFSVLKYHGDLRQIPHIRSLAECQVAVLWTWTFNQDKQINLNFSNLRQFF